MDNIRTINTHIKKRQRRLYIIAALAACIAAGSAAYIWHQQGQEEIAQNDMFQAVRYFEKEQFDKALKGDGVFVGLLEIADNYRFTKAGKLARFYIGTAYMQQGEHKKAIEHLSRFSTGDGLIQARAWVLTGDAYMNEKDYKKAAMFYSKAAKHYPNKGLTPQYLMKASLAHEAAQQIKEALQSYEHILKEFPQSSQQKEAQKHAARLKCLLEQPLSK